ncbi:MAG: hypothetical protein M3Q97_11010, partial [Bacteroidota bacterium]|nr:hypothetical protein [Bacteroidota bacterium]
MPVAAQTTSSSTIATPLDDMEEYVSNGNIDWNSSDLELVNEGGGDQLVGLRFTGLAIPQGAGIVRAYIQFTADNTHSGITTLKIEGQAADNADAFANVQFSISPRPRTQANVSWVVDPWLTAQERSDAQRTSDIRTVIQEIVSRPGWTTSSALALIITGTGKREAESYEGANAGDPGHAANQAATLVIEWVMPEKVTAVIAAGLDDMEEYVANGNVDWNSSDLELINESGGDQKVGLRFTNMNIPQGAIILKSYLQFTADNTHSGSTTLRIYGEASDNAAQFQNAQFSVSSRTKTTQNISWTVSPWSKIQEQDTAQRSPDLSSILQAIVNRPGWSNSSALGILIEGSGKREAESYEGATSTNAGHSPTQAPTLVIEYIVVEKPKAPKGIFPIPVNAVWRYLDDGSNQGAAWKNASFDDKSWAFGPAELGYGDGDEATLVSFGGVSSNKHITTYFRHVFNMEKEDIDKIDSLMVGLVRDDGAIVYLNGTEIFRSNMPTGTVDFKTLAANSTGSETVFNTTRISKSLLVEGENVIAVEIHQDAPTSSDISFKLIMSGFKSDLKVITAGTDWKFNDKGSNLGTTWKNASYNDASWKSGNTVLGFGNGDEATKLDGGNDASRRTITYYFRKTFTISDTTGYGTLKLNLKRDDGAIVYINDEEVFRSNMPVGAINYKTTALQFVEGEEENAWITAVISKNVLRTGTNVIAIEVHQNSQTSTDLRFDLELTLPGVNSPITYTKSNVTCDPLSSTHISCFTSVNPAAKGEVAVFPSTH